MESYIRIMKLLKLYFAQDGWEKYFLSGGCFWLADYLHRRIRDSVIMINRVEEHCALYFEQKLYDVRGDISKYNFHRASPREIMFMKKNYIPAFDSKKLESYLKMREINGEGKRYA